MAQAQFKVGDEVTTSRPSMAKGTIVFGPYRSAANGQEWALVQAPDGTAVSVPVDSLSLTPSFAVGETATDKAMGLTVEVVAGPFNAAGSDRYVVKRRNGVHSWVGVNGLVKRASEAFSAPSRNFPYKGRTYSLDGEYEDRQGDVWRLNGRSDSDGMPLMDCPLYPTFRDYRLSSVVNEYGPLSRA